MKPGFASNGSWNEATGATIVAVAEGLFRVTLPMQGERLFCRVRVLDFGDSGPPLLINEVMSDAAWRLFHADTMLPVGWVGR